MNNKNYSLPPDTSDKVTKQFLMQLSKYAQLFGLDLTPKQKQICIQVIRSILQELFTSPENGKKLILSTGKTKIQLAANLNDY